MEEKWAEIPNTNGAYFISNLGRVKSVPYSAADKNGRVVRYRGKILSPVSNGVGYLKVRIRINGIKSGCYIHRMVAEAFIPNPEGKREVNHKDFDPGNNAVSNLEWVSGLENVRYSQQRGRMQYTEQRRRNLTTAIRATQAKPVVGRRIDDGTEIRYEALDDCAKDGFQPSCVCNCCKGIRHTHKGYEWRYGQKRL